MQMVLNGPWNAAFLRRAPALLESRVAHLETCEASCGVHVSMSGHASLLLWTPYEHCFKRGSGTLGAAIHCRSPPVCATWMRFCQVEAAHLGHLKSMGRERHHC
eukprot:TRINITY_DN24724_c0_g1_i1.p1 TRINITY_DN24724_c0_g1~~TRINITY_DN24724_c0_g1_i1.p1  ORF type:complete len:104 (+),score=10.77 TRINITY_DN24724_c0_g1_i1:7-318(+)